MWRACHNYTSCCGGTNWGDEMAKRRLGEEFGGAHNKRAIKTTMRMLRRRRTRRKFKEATRSWVRGAWEEVL